MSTPEQFNLSGYGQNLAATITAAIIFGVAWLVRNKCKHSRCAELKMYSMFRRRSGHNPRTTIPGETASNRSR